VRAAVGPDVAIAVDFSQSLHGQGFRNDTAIVHLRALEKAGVNVFEQPVADGDLEGLAKISAPTFPSILRLGDSLNSFVLGFLVVFIA